MLPCNSNQIPSLNVQSISNCWKKKELSARSHCNDSQNSFIHKRTQLKSIRHVKIAFKLLERQTYVRSVKMNFKSRSEVFFFQKRNICEIFSAFSVANSEFIGRQHCYKLMLSKVLTFPEQSIDWRSWNSMILCHPLR